MCSTAAKRKWKCLGNVDVLKRKTYLILIYSKKVSCSIIRVLILKTSSLVFNVTLGFVLAIFTVFFSFEFVPSEVVHVVYNFVQEVLVNFWKNYETPFRMAWKSMIQLGLALMKHLEQKRRVTLFMVMRNKQVKARRHRHPITKSSFCVTFTWKTKKWKTSRTFCGNSKNEPL